MCPVDAERVAAAAAATASASASASASVFTATVANATVSATATAAAAAAVAVDASSPKRPVVLEDNTLDTTTTSSTAASGGDMTTSLISESASSTSSMNITATSSPLKSNCDLVAGAEEEASRAVALQKARDEVKFFKAQFDEVELENEHLKARLKTKGADFGKLKARALELRKAARQSRLNELRLRKVLRKRFEKLEEARRQLKA